MAASYPAADVACAIIAGGQARRFGGRVKALIEVAGVPIIERQLRVLHGRISSVAIMANDPMPFAAGSGVAAVVSALPVIPDRLPGRGPLAGLEAASSHFPHEWVLALASDMPYVDARLLDLLLARRGPEVDVVAPIRAGRPEPLCALYARRILPIVRARLEAGRLSLQGLLYATGVRVAWVLEDELRTLDAQLRFLANVNNPDDLV